MKKSTALYLSAREASAELAISPATLYAYVSRGLIRSEPSSDSRSHRYRAEDVRGLKERRAPSPEPRGLKNFDADLPVMDSAISTITEQGPIYRGVNCIDLADKDTLEHAATLLWDVTGADPFSSDNCPHLSAVMRAVAEAARGAAPIDRTIAVLALAASADPRAFTRAADGRAMVGGRIMRLVVATMLNAKSSAKPLHLQIARVWAPDNKHAADLIRRALVLLADHELNASTFTVRCAASTGLNLYDSIIAGLVALKGPKHGGASVLAAQLLKTLANGEVAPSSASASRSANASRALVMASTSMAIPARGPCWKRWRAPARTVNSPTKSPSASPKRPASSSISTMPLRCWCTRSACRPAMNWCCFPWRARWGGSRMPANNCGMAG